MEQMKIEFEVTKVCSKCKRELALSCFSVNKSKKDGLCINCKECQKKYYKRNKKLRIEYSKQYREDNKESISEYQKQYQKQYYENNSESICERQKQYYEENRKSRIEYQKKYHEDNNESICEYHKQYRKCNKESIIEYQSEYYKENQEKYANRGHRRRQRKKNASIGDQSKCEAIIAKCKRMNKEAGFAKYNVDHIFPLRAKGSSGLHCWWNLQILEASVNKSKNNKLLPEDLEAWHNELISKFG